MNPSDLTAIIQALGHGSYLGVFIIVTGYLRHLFSANSRLPINIPPKWLPSISALCGLLFGLFTTRMAGMAWGLAILGGAIAAGTSGFVDGLLVAIWGDASQAPGWARLFAMIFDDLTGGTGGDAGGARGTNSSANGPVAPVMKRRALRLAFPVLGLVLVAYALACGPDAKQEATAPIAIEGAICSAVEAQPEPAWVLFACEAADVAADVAKKFTLKVPAAQAKSFAAAHAPPAK